MRIQSLESQNHVTLVIFCWNKHCLMLKFSMITSGWTRGATFTAVLSCLVLTSCLCHAQETSESTRKIVTRVAPQYPSLARGMRLQGGVRLEAVVEPDGSVKTVGIKGGHPVLAEAARDAIRNWKWAPASKETREFVEVKFSP